MKIQDIHAFLDQKAPFATAEDWDNPGLLVGDPAAPVTTVVVALDATPAALEAARQAGAELLLTHHPVIFHPLKVLTPAHIPYQAAAAGIAVLSAHTNLDKAAGGVNDTLAARLGLTDVHPGPDGMSRIGVLPEQTDARRFAAAVGEALHTAVRVNGSRPVRRVAVCGGSGGEFLPALAAEADAYVTGEARHHEWLLAEQRGLTLLEAGHYATEVPVVDTLCRWLTDAFPGLSVIPFPGTAPYDTITR